jgi:hypothetical protein
MAVRGLALEIPHRHIKRRVRLLHQTATTHGLEAPVDTRGVAVMVQGVSFSNSGDVVFGDGE